MKRGVEEVEEEASGRARNLGDTVRFPVLPLCIPIGRGFRMSLFLAVLTADRYLDKRLILDFTDIGGLLRVSRVL